MLFTHASRDLRSALRLRRLAKSGLGLHFLRACLGFASGLASLGVVCARLRVDFFRAVLGLVWGYTLLGFVLAPLKA